MAGAAILAAVFLLFFLGPVGIFGLIGTVLGGGPMAALIGTAIVGGVLGTKLLIENAKKEISNPVKRIKLTPEEKAAEVAKGKTKANQQDLEGQGMSSSLAEKVAEHNAKVAKLNGKVAELGQVLEPKQKSAGVAVQQMGGVIDKAAAEPPNDGLLFVDKVPGLAAYFESKTPEQQKAMSHDSSDPGGVLNVAALKAQMQADLQAQGDAGVKGARDLGALAQAMVNEGQLDKGIATFNGGAPAPNALEQLAQNKYSAITEQNAAHAEQAALVAQGQKLQAEAQIAMGDMQAGAAAVHIPKVETPAPAAPAAPAQAAPAPAQAPAQQAPAPAHAYEQGEHIPHEIAALQAQMNFTNDQVGVHLGQEGPKPAQQAPQAPAQAPKPAAETPKGPETPAPAPKKKVHSEPVNSPKGFPDGSPLAVLGSGGPGKGNGVSPTTAPTVKQEEGKGQGASQG
jgi:hypothetical protein